MQMRLFVRNFIKLPKISYIVNANSEGSFKAMWMSKLVSAFAVHFCVRMSHSWRK